MSSAIAPTKSASLSDGKEGPSHLLAPTHSEHTVGSRKKSCQESLRSAGESPASHQCTVRRGWRSRVGGVGEGCLRGATSVYGQAKILQAFSSTLAPGLCDVHILTDSTSGHPGFSRGQKAREHHPRQVCTPLPHSLK